MLLPIILINHGIFILPSNAYSFMLIFFNFQCTDAYLDIPRARLCVETTLERFANRQLTVTESWENWQTTVVTTRERRIEHERRIEESTKTLAWTSKFSEQLYPLLTSESTQPSVLLQDLESIQLGILPELKKAVIELEARIKSVASTSIGGNIYFFLITLVNF